VTFVCQPFCHCDKYLRNGLEEERFIWLSVREFSFWLAGSIAFKPMAKQKNMAEENYSTHSGQEADREEEHKMNTSKSGPQ
jgi:hypothetical protein